MTYPDYILWPHSELWVLHQSDGTYVSLDGIYTRSYRQLIESRHDARVLTDAGPAETSAEPDGCALGTFRVYETWYRCTLTAGHAGDHQVVEQ